MAQVLPGPATLVLPGQLAIHANDHATITTTADGKTSGAGVGVGAAVAVGVDREITTAQLARGANVHAILLQADNSSPTTTTATAGAKGGKNFLVSLGEFINTVVNLVDPNLGTRHRPGNQRVRPQRPRPEPGESAPGRRRPERALEPAQPAAAPAVGGGGARRRRRPAPDARRARGECGADLGDPRDDPDQRHGQPDHHGRRHGASGNAIAAHLSLAANYAGGNNQVAVGKGASITAPSITLTAGGPGRRALTAKAFGGAGSLASAAASVALNAGDPAAPNTVQVTVASGSHLTATKGNVSLGATSNVTSTALAGGGRGPGGRRRRVDRRCLPPGEGQRRGRRPDRCPRGQRVADRDRRTTTCWARRPRHRGLGTVNAAVRADILGKTVEAHIDPGGDVHAFGDVTINAVTNDDPQAIGVGLGLSAAVLQAEATGVALNEHTWAFINGATVHANANVLLGADSSVSYDPLAATGSLGAIANIGVNGTLFYESEDTQAYISGGAVVDALALGAADNVLTGTETNGVPATRPDPRRLAHVDQLRRLPAARRLDRGRAHRRRPGSGIATVLNNHVVAYIGGGAKVNQNDAGSASGQLVNLLAWDDTQVVGEQGDVGVAPARASARPSTSR